MLNPHDGVLTFEQPSLRIDPALKRSEFLTADWAQGAADLVVNPPWHSWKLDGEYWSMSERFVVLLYFEGERLAMLDLCNSDARFGTSWADYSEEKERRRKESHDAWLSKCVGEERSFAWGVVWSGDGNTDPHAGGASLIIIRYSALPPGGAL